MKAPLLLRIDRSTSNTSTAPGSSPSPAGDPTYYSPVAVASATSSAHDTAVVRGFRVMFSLAASCGLLLACWRLLAIHTDTSSAVAYGSASLVQTACGRGNASCETAEKLVAKPDVSFRPDFDFEGPIINVGLKPVGPEILGFGGAFTEASATVFSHLSAQNKEQIIERYFGRDGLGYTLGRVAINSCDFSLASYSFDDAYEDFELAHFDDDVAHDSKAIIPFIKAAMQRAQTNGKAMRLLGSPWSPPAWMKENGQMLHSSAPCLRPEARASWAAYFVRWISAYKARGVPIWAVTVQNEPENNATWESCLYSPLEMADFIGQHLGPALEAEHPEVQIFAYDHNKDQLYAWANVIFSHPTAANFVDGIAYHWYGGDGFENVERVHREIPEAVLLASEATYERYRWKEGTVLSSGDWAMGEGYAHDIMGDLSAGSLGWMDWNLLLDEHGGPNHVGNVCDAAIMANMTAGDIFVHPQYFYIGHFSKYIWPGSRLLENNVTGSSTYRGETRPYGTCDSRDGLQSTAFLRYDGTISVVVLNCGSNDVRFKLRHGHRAFEGNIPAHGIQTYVFSS